MNRDSKIVTVKAAGDGSIDLWSLFTGRDRTPEEQAALASRRELMADMSSRGIDDDFIGLALSFDSYEERLLNERGPVTQIKVGIILRGAPLWVLEEYRDLCVKAFRALDSRERMGLMMCENGPRWDFWRSVMGEALGGVDQGLRDN